MKDRRIIILFVKYPQKGRVKTRLARTLGDDAAVSIYCQLVMGLVRMLRGVDVDEVRVCFDPEEKAREVEKWLSPIWEEAGEKPVSGNITAIGPALVFRPQCEGDLGARLKSAFGEVFQENGEAGMSGAQVVAIGSDCTEIDGETFQAAWDTLGIKDIVFGPTFDGGYYLVGMKRLYPELFTNIPWSEENTLKVSLQYAQEANREVGMLDEKHDIDTEEDWLRQGGDIPDL